MIRRRTIASTLLAPAILAAGGCDWMPGKPTEADKPVIKTTITAYTELWTNHCSGCHGADGRWGGARPMNDPLYLAIADDEYLTRITAEGVPGSLMPGFGHAAGGPMTDAQIKIVVDGMRSHWANPAATRDLTLPPLTGAAGNVARGAQVFKTYCGACHGDNGRGGTAGSVVNDSYLALVTDQALRATVICGRIDLGCTNFAGYVGGHKTGHRSPLPDLSDQQIDDVVAWLASHRMDYPGQPYPNTNTLVSASGGEPN